MKEKADAVARLPLPGADVANPLAGLTRAELESVVVGLTAIVAVALNLEAAAGASREKAVAPENRAVAPVDAPRDAPNVRTPGSSGERLYTPAGKRPRTKGNGKTP
jgi:hypothetical protein